MTNLGFLTLCFVNFAMLLFFSCIRVSVLILFCYSSHMLGDGLLGLLIRIHVHSRTGGGRGGEGRQVTPLNLTSLHMEYGGLEI